MPNSITADSSGHNFTTFRYLGHTYRCATADPVDPDISGIGVSVSFWASATLTFVSIVCGYLTNSFPGVQQNVVDRILKRKLYRLFRKKYTHSRPDRRTEKAFEGFLLAFSDQQLVTGFALLVSAFFKGDVTVYSFNVVSALGWFSSTIHLATLVVLRQYFRNNKVARIVRISFMLPIAGLLLATNIIGTSVPFYAQPWTAIFCAYQQAQNRPNFDYFISIWLLFSLINRIALICSPESRHPSRSWVYNAAMRRLDPGGEIGSLQTRLSKHVRKSEKASSRNTLVKKACVIGRLFLLAHDELVGSFAWELIWMVLSFTYGIAQSVVVWISCVSPDGGDCLSSIMEMGFGQTVSLIFLVLPFLAFVEAFFGKPEEAPGSLHTWDMTGRTPTHLSSMDTTNEVSKTDQCHTVNPLESRATTLFESETSARGFQQHSGEVCLETSNYDAWLQQSLPSSNHRLFGLLTMTLIIMYLVPLVFIGIFSKLIMFVLILAPAVWRFIVDLRDLAITVKLKKQEGNARPASQNERSRAED